MCEAHETYASHVRMLHRREVIKIKPTKNHIEFVSYSPMTKSYRMLPPNSCGQIHATMTKLSNKNYPSGPHVQNPTKLHAYKKLTENY